MDLDKRITIRNLNVLIPSRKSTRLRWKEYQILSLLVAKSPELVTRTEIIASIWKGTYCSDSTINQTIKSIRQKIGDSDHTIIRTIPRLGYKVEQRAIFDFLNDEGDDEESIWDSESLIAEGIQRELSGMVKEESASAEADKNAAAEPDSSRRKLATPLSRLQARLGLRKNNRPGYFSLLRRRSVNVVSVLALLVVIANVFFYLGNQAYLPGDPALPVRVMLTLKLSDAGHPAGLSSYSLLCMYQGDKSLHATIECIDPKRGRFQQQYRDIEIKDSGEIQLILPENFLPPLAPQKKDN